MERKEEIKTKQINVTEFIVKTEPESETRMRITLSFTVNRRYIYVSLNRLMKMMIEFLKFPGGKMLKAFGEAFEHLNEADEPYYDDIEPHPLFR